MKISDAIKQIIAVEFRERNEYLRHLIAIEQNQLIDTSKREYHIRKIIEFQDDLNNDARQLLRQWLRDGKIRAFHSDPRLGGDVEIHPSTWGLAITDAAIKDGDYAADGDVRFSGPVGLHFGDVLEILIGGDQDCAVVAKSTASSLSEAAKPNATYLATRVTHQADKSLGGPADTPPDHTNAVLSAKVRTRADVKRALTAVYGPDVKLWSARKVKANPLYQWLEDRNLKVPGDLPRTIRHIIRAEKKK
jgi:hypothetical protein